MDNTTRKFPAAPPPPSDRLMPQDLDAEKCLLACLMLAGDDLEAIMGDALGAVGKGSFYSGDHAIIFEAITNLHSRRVAIDAVLLCNELRRMGQYDDVGGAAYIAEVMGTVPSCAHFAHYLGVVRNKHLLRQVIVAANQCVEDAHREFDDAQSILARSAGRFADLLEGGAPSGLVTIGEAMERALAQVKAGGVDAVPWGLPGMEDTGGIGIGEVAILGARPSMGKSLVAKQVAASAAIRGHGVLYISLEESVEKLGRNRLSSETGIENRMLRQGEVKDFEVEMLVEAVARNKSLPWRIDTVATDPRKLDASIARAKHRYGVRLVVIDYLQLLDGDGESRYAKVTETMLGISRSTRRHGVATLLLCQLNRESTKRDGAVPTMADLRESGQIEQDADQIILLHRPEYYKPDDRPGEADLIRAKMRDGVRGGCVSLRAELERQLLTQLVSIGGDDPTPAQRKAAMETMKVFPRVPGQAAEIHHADYTPEPTPFD